MRNFHRGGGHHKESSNFSRNNDRDNRNRPNDNYKRPADRGFKSSFSERNGRSRRDFDDSGRSQYNKDNRDGGHNGNRSFGGGNNRSYGPERSFRNQKPDQRSFRNQTPPRPRDRDNSGSRFNRSNDTRSRPGRPSTPPSTFRNRNDFQPSSSIRTRPPRGAGQSRRGMASSGPRILRRNDLRSSLISKRTAPINRSKEYIKKIKIARMKLSEGSSKLNIDDESNTPPKDVGEDKHDDDAVDILDVANDIEFDEDDEEKASEKGKKKEELDKTSSEKASAGGTSKAVERSNRAESEKDDSKESDDTIDLKCIHCLTKCSSLQDFRFHLTRRTHLIAMRKVSIKVRLTLNRLRKVQRDRQLEIEARLKNVETIPSKYCQICKLYFRQTKLVHRETEDHKKIRNFLKPYCKICRVQLLSAMKYEIHKSTVNHLKMKANKHDTSDDIDIQDLDLGDFKTVDSIGDVDGEEVESTIDDEEFDENEPVSTSVGQEFVNKVEVNYCSLCREYLRIACFSNDGKIIADHCKSKKHLKWYFQSKKKNETSENKNSDEPMEVSKIKDDQEPSSIQDTEKVSKKQAETKEKADKAESKDDENDSTVNNEAGTPFSAEKDEKPDEDSKKFPRYFETV